MMLRALSLSLLLILASVCWAEPQLNRISPRGLQIGGVTRVTISGANLTPHPQLLLPPGGSAVLVGEAKPDQAAFDVTLPAEVSPGIYPLRIGTAAGLSHPLKIGVDDLPQTTLADQIEQLPIAISGHLTG
ncbi:MAG: hypothetical protein ACIALR_10790, partial [Blastopirellula sp. JB062]